MSHTWSHGVTDAVPNGVTDVVTDAVRPSGVTLLQTRPDQTRVLVQVSCGVFALGLHASHGDLDSAPSMHEKPSMGGF